MTRKYIDNAFTTTLLFQPSSLLKIKRKLIANSPIQPSSDTPHNQHQVQLTTALLRETGKESEMLKWSQTTQLNL